MLSTLAMAGFAGYLVVLVKDVLDVLKETDSHGRAALSGVARLGWQALALAPLAALAYGGAWLCGQQLANAATRDLRNDLLAHLVQLDLGFHQRMSRGDLLSRMTADVETTGELFGQIFGKLLQRPAESIGTVVFLFYVNRSRRAGEALVSRTYDGRRRCAAPGFCGPVEYLQTAPGRL